MITNFRLDRRGIGEILKSNEMLDFVNGSAVQVAAAVRGLVGSDATVTFRPNITDRQRATVIVRGSRADHRAALIRAARDAGLEVTEYPPQ